jgi:hypothetical protein
MNTDKKDIGKKQTINTLATVLQPSYNAELFAQSGVFDASLLLHQCSSD